MKKKKNKYYNICLTNFVVSVVLFSIYAFMLNIRFLTCQKNKGNNLDSGYSIIIFDYKESLIHTLIQLGVIIGIIIIIIITIYCLVKTYKNKLYFNRTIRASCFTILFIFITILVLITDFKYQNNLQTDDNDIVCLDYHKK